MDKSVGEKIRIFRKRLGISQMELELRINSSPGSISRIENGTINPTKETLLKIVNQLNLKPYEYASLFNLHEKAIPTLLNNVIKLNSSLDFKESLQNSVDAIAEELNLTAAVIFTTNEERGTLHSNTMSKNWITDRVLDIVFKILGKKFEDVEISLTKHNDNLLVKTINERRIFYTKDLRQCTLHAYPQLLSDLVSKIVGFKSGLSIPIITCNKCIGAMFYVTNYATDFRSDIPVLKAFTNQIATALSNCRKYQELRNEVELLKSTNKS